MFLERLLVIADDRGDHGQCHAPTLLLRTDGWRFDEVGTCRSPTTTLIDMSAVMYLRDCLWLQRGGRGGDAGCAGARLLANGGGQHCAEGVHLDLAVRRLGGGRRRGEDLPGGGCGRGQRPEPELVGAFVNQLNCQIVSFTHMVSSRLLSAHPRRPCGAIAPWVIRQHHWRAAAGPVVGVRAEVEAACVPGC